VRGVAPRYRGGGLALDHEWTTNRAKGGHDREGEGHEGRLTR
jgi:hypothetical protein